MARKLIQMKKNGYPLVNSVGYFEVMAKKRKWTCKPWVTVNVGPEGKLVLPCYVRNEYVTSASVFENGIKKAISGFNWKETRNCQNCNLHCYVEPSLALSGDFRTFLNWSGIN
jgi:hypothetical protein